MKKFIFGIAAIAIVAAGTNYAIKIAANSMYGDQNFAAASIGAKR